MRWSDFVLPFLVGAFMAVQSYAASRTWGIANPNTIAIVALSVISTLFLLGLLAKLQTSDGDPGPVTVLLSPPTAYRD